jgi:cytoskeletal protein CcmA (bactofilin family)
MVVERKSDIQCFRRVTVTNIEIKGRMSGEIVATGSVAIHKTGSLDGNVTAKSIAIEKGGMFSGQLVIGQVSLTQGELLPESKPAEAKKESGVAIGAAQPAHAT